MNAAEHAVKKATHLRLDNGAVAEQQQALPERVARLCLPEAQLEMRECCGS